MAEKIYQLLYVSQATEPLSDAGCAEINTVSRKNNVRENITGFLAYLPNDAIIQMLEGDKHSVQRKYERISIDTRHKNPTVVFETECDVRQFYGWSMGYHKVSESEAAEMSDYIDLRDAKALANVGNGPAVVLMLKAIFAATHAKS